MSQIHTYTTVHCRFEDAPKRLYAHLKDGVGTLPLGIALGDLHIETNVEVRVREKSTFTGYHMMDIGWRPSTSGPYPEFNGTLTISQDTIALRPYRLRVRRGARASNCRGDRESALGETLRHAHRTARSRLTGRAVSPRQSIRQSARGRRSVFVMTPERSRM